MSSDCRTLRARLPPSSIDADQEVDRVDVLVRDLRGDLVCELEHTLGPGREAAVEPAVARRLHLCTAVSSAAWQIDETGSWASFTASASVSGR